MSSKPVPYGKRGTAKSTKKNSSVQPLTDEMRKELKRGTDASVIATHTDSIVPVTQPATVLASATPSASTVTKLTTKKRAKPEPVQSTAPDSVKRVPYVADSQKLTIAHVETFKGNLKQYDESQRVEETTNPYLTDTTIYMPPTRRTFYQFIRDTYEEKFGLEIRTGDEKIDIDACAKLGLAGDQRVESFLYQKFIREYIRQASPYRGILVYHGLGSGKTCSAIAAAESLYGVANKRIIVMTPFSLRQNFINEISFCGFRHLQTNNHWVSQTMERDKDRYAQSVQLYARTVLSLSDLFIKNALRREHPERRVIWIPIFTKAPNFKTLDAQSQNDIRSQIQETINNRITFINYNGVTSHKLKEYACKDASGGTIFDDAVIIIDEFHNLTRLMQGSIVPYLMERSGKKRKIPAEPIVPGPWIPKLCGKAMNYKRAFLFYRLLCGAKDSKIIALSGTPIINFPEELAIISNVLGGYIDCVETYLTTSDDALVTSFIKMVDKDRRVDIIRVQAGTGIYKVLISVFPVGYIKVIDEATGEFLGVKRASDEDEVSIGKRGITEVFQTIKDNAIRMSIPISGTEKFISYPRLPPDGETFRKNFINESTLGIENSTVLKKRLTGIISYYRGSKEEYMPRIARNEIVACGMSDYVLSKYSEARNYELKLEMNKKEGDTGDVFADVEYFAKKKNPSSYRFRSRAICNFAFPKGIVRPFPINERAVDKETKDIEGTDIVDDIANGQVNPDEDRVLQEEVDKEDATITGPEEDDAVDGDEIEQPIPPVAEIRTYEEMIQRALADLNKNRDRLLKLSATSPEMTLAQYSPKMARMLENIMLSQGSNMMYSQFKTVEGLGVFGIAMKANGLSEIVIEGTDAEPYFSEETDASLRKGPTSGEKRFIYFTGEGSKERRNLILNIFNGSFDKLPQRIRAPFIESGYVDVKNKRGEICWVFGLTGAGAEGISLKNVRSVHIMEPYWNMVRLDQVKGRAVRICSHADLPFDDRAVEIFTYYTAFSQDQIDNKKIDQTILNTDRSETSDQKVLNVSMRKQQMNDTLINVMKESAIDCTMNLPDNGNIRCFNIYGSSGQYMFDPDLEVDKLLTQTEFVKGREEVPIESAVTTQRAGEDKFQIVEIEVSSGIVDRFIIKKDEHNKYTLFTMKDTRMQKPVGYIDMDPISGELMEPVFYQ